MKVCRDEPYREGAIGSYSDRTSGRPLGPPFFVSWLAGVLLDLGGLTDPSSGEGPTSCARLVFPSASMAACESGCRLGSRRVGRVPALAEDHSSARW